MRRTVPLALVTALAACAPPAADYGAVFDGTGGRWVDLTHAFSELTIYWPTEGMSRALLKLPRRLDSRLRNHLRRFPEPELRVARSERRHQLGHVLTAFDTAEALGRFQHPGGDPA